MKSRVNELCQSRGLQPIPQRNEGITNGEYWAAARGQDVWKEELREAIDCVRQKAKSYDDFKATLENEWGVTVTRDHGRGMTYTHPTNGKKVRGQKLGPAYDKPSLMKAFTTEKKLPIRPATRTTTKNVTARRISSNESKKKCIAAGACKGGISKWH